ncbi:orotate phosphoribosyltransferase [Methylotenera sp.]|uniref:orotate phosphoribosyltransferase n=1 Tax=Methylotenera sp. TaxID=2051956 RepID=UPI002722D4DD|nr:orotate phosphoribosyltransferase [Methylotenera sp.]MDO9392370.1 orotate phosphoribosyltransferase [Methylotenera sp.]MDP2070565.1 orotate phosphoribosyltransferase [Methylotenera sp.]MDP2229704.1 orotate phosphoribosyltransferase [Methylotenera sp.]MDP3006165.1 orotate phosphoribosyltransferase [Methylotenera sp.]MDP3141979.1 orotate phosphoribosyltransferase [Methylotenera sp.]
MTTTNTNLQSDQFRQEFIAFAIKKEVLRFGEFKTKAGRLSPYFFNAGLFNDGMSLMKLGEFYAEAIKNSGIEFDMLFGPAYKGITLVASIAIAFAKNGHNVPYAYNRKEAKGHGEGGLIVGSPLKGRVLIIDDVISAGTSVRESVELIAANGANACGVAIAIDRQERGIGELSAVQEVIKTNGIPVCAIANLSDLLSYLQKNQDMAQNLLAVKSYRQQYGVN